MHKKPSKQLAKTKTQSLATEYEHILADMIKLLEQARHTAARAVTSVMTPPTGKLVDVLWTLSNEGETEKIITAKKLLTAAVMI